MGEPEQPRKDKGDARRGQLRNVVAVSVVLLLAYLFAYPVDFDPAVYEPGESLPMSGALAPNEALKQAEVFNHPLAEGPEDVAVMADGTMVVGTHHGELVKVSADGSKVDKWTRTGGRPLGLAWDADGNLIVADAVTGLLSVAPDGTVTTLSTEAAGVPFKFTDDVDVASDGRIYFSDASSRWGYGDHLPDMLEGRGYGRLLRYDPSSKATEVLLDGLFFANGVALSSSEDFVLVNETTRSRVLRYWLKGDKAGSHDVFLDALPGYPDGISNNGKDRFWLAIFTVNNAMGRWLAPKPFLKKAVYRLPRVLWPKPQPYGFVIALDEAGTILESLQDTSGEHVSNVTSVEEQDGKLYFGTLHANRLARMSVPTR